MSSSGAVTTGIAVSSVGPFKMFKTSSKSTCTPGDLKSVSMSIDVDRFRASSFVSMRQISKAFAWPRNLAAPSMNSESVISPS